MKKNIAKKDLIVLVLAMFVFVPLDVWAAQIIPCTGGDSCRACDLVSLINNVIKFLIVIGSLVGTLACMYAGFLLVTGGDNQSTRAKAKGMFTGVVVGIAIMMSGYVIVDLMIKSLVDPAYFAGKQWWDIECISNAPVITPAALEQAEVTTRDVPASASTGGAAPQDATADSAARAQLAAAGVRFNSDVSLQGISQQRVQEIADLARRCAADIGSDCGVVVSSGVRLPGNPAGVGPHNGNAVDISGRSTTFNNWMRTQSGLEQVSSFSTYTGLRNGAGTTCTWEGPDNDNPAGSHWHCQS